MYALVIDGTIELLAGRLPAGAKRLDTGEWVTPPNGSWDPAEAEACGWFPVLMTDRPDDTETHTYDAAYGVVDGEPVLQWVERELTADEIEQRASRNARIDDLARRVEILEAAVFGSPEAPTDPEDPSVKTWAEWGGIVPPGQLLRDVDGSVYRNVAGVPLTTPPSGMPGGPGPWGHLWALVLDGEEPGDPGEPEAPAWAAGVSYQVGDVVQYNGRLYECKQAHTSLAGWEPTNVPALWQDNGPVV